MPGGTGWEVAGVHGALKSRYPHTLECPLDNTCGMLLYSRLPLLKPGIRFLVEEGVPSMKTGIQLRSRDKVNLRCLHPRPPRPTHASDHRDAELVLVAREIDRDRTPCIVIAKIRPKPGRFPTRAAWKSRPARAPSTPPGRGFTGTSGGTGGIRFREVFLKIFRNINT